MKNDCEARLLLALHSLRIQNPPQNPHLLLINFDFCLVLELLAAFLQQPDKGMGKSGKENAGHSDD
ncbi:hypothetical protein [Chitinibacter sp. S2-10]|uniref:hypothetical protein n=1 Tax=Chitinibacter sp. S2-10 TaxID=3373597 RepID=UPI0039773F61